MTAPMLTLAKLSLRLEVSKPTLREWIEAGKFPQGTPDPSGVVRWSENVVKAWQTLYEAGFFKWAVKASRAENLGKRRETTGRSDGPKPAG